MNLKTVLFKGTLFLTILVMISAFLGPVFTPTAGSLGKGIKLAQAFYELPKDSLDIIYLGASTFMRGISPLMLWEKYGITGFVRAGPEQAPLVSYYLLLETLKYQNPQLVILDASSLYQEEIDVEEREEWLRVAVDPMRLSIEKLRLIYEITSRSKNQSMISYLFPFIRYHSRWEELQITDYSFYRKELRTNKFKGFRPSTDFPELEGSIDSTESTGTIEEIPEFARVYYLKIIELCKAKGIALILLSTPRSVWPISRHELVQSFADSQEVEYLDYSLPESVDKLGIDFTMDSKDGNHLNTIGGVKVTKELGAYLIQKYTFENKHTDPDYANWNEDLKIYKWWIRHNVPQAELLN